MKVDENEVIAQLKTLGVTFRGIQDCLRSGDDGFEETIDSLCEDGVKIINRIIAEHLTKFKPNQQQIDFDAVPAFLKQAEQAIKNIESGKHNQNDLKLSIQNKMYAFLVRQYKEDISNMDIPDDQVSHHLEYRLFQSDLKEAAEKWFHSSLEVVEYLTKTILEQRTKSRKQVTQTVLFDEKPQTKKGNTLIDRITDSSE